ncbi:MAG: MidA family [Verrucomicrobia bacterium]|nr:MAG: MidA family [Verrucomicrobiota bacterium]
MPSLEHILSSRINAGGAISFSDFMEAALYDPLHGYYASAKARIGSSGDFATAVSSGPLFGRLLARQFHEMWDHLGRPGSWLLVEQGAFDGRLCADILEGLSNFAPECFAATSIALVEPFSLLQRRQADTLRSFQKKITWYRECSTLPVFTGVHYSNELLDAFPFHFLRSNASGWEELRVGASHAGFEFQPHPIREPALREAAASLPAREPGFITEISLQPKLWLRSLRQKLKTGWLLTFDYGMTQPELLSPHRKDGTASAYFAHQRQPSLLTNPGAQDLTAHVNFSATTRDALSEGWHLSGYTDQHRFFSGLAPLHFQDATERPTLQQQKELLAFRTLTHPQLMGSQFKAWCLSRGEMPKLSGFKYGAGTLSSLEN